MKLLHKQCSNWVVHEIYDLEDGYSYEQSFQL